MDVDLFMPAVCDCYGYDPTDCKTCGGSGQGRATKENRDRIAAAKAVCAGCEVQAECMEVAFNFATNSRRALPVIKESADRAVARKNVVGVFAGMTEGDRSKYEKILKKGGSQIRRVV